MRTETTPQRHRDTEEAIWVIAPDVVCESDPLTEQVIGCAIEVHRHLGPGLLESTYEEAMCIELAERGLRFVRQLPVPIHYKGHLLGDYRLDLLIEDTAVVEIKSVERYDPVFQAQLLTYLRATNKRVGLLINFNSRLLHDGVKRVVL
jgi:GxxExxY protein